MKSRVQQNIYRVGGLYVSSGARDLVIPSSPIKIDLGKVDRTLVTKFYPGLFGMLRILPSRFAHDFKDKSIIGFCIASGNWLPFICELEEHPTWDYVTHALAYARTGDEAQIEAVWKRGKDAWKRGGVPLGRWRRINEFEKVATNRWTPTQAKQYVERIAGLAKLIEKSNSVPHSTELSGESRRLDENVGVAIGASGELLHFRRGHHRIMLAKQMGLSKLSVVIHLIHTRWLLDSQGLTKQDIASFIEAGESEPSFPLANIVREHVEKFSR